MQPCASARSRARPSPAHASSAIAWSVMSASHIRQSSPETKPSSGSSARSRNASHSSDSSPGSGPLRSSTQALQALPASSTAAGQPTMRAGGHCAPTGGWRSSRCASERSRIDSVRANRSGGHWRSSSLIGPSTVSCQIDAGDSFFELSRRIVSTCSGDIAPSIQQFLGDCLLDRAGSFLASPAPAFA